MENKNIIVTNYGQTNIHLNKNLVHSAIDKIELKNETETKSRAKDNQLGKFELFIAENDKWHFRLKARNGEIIATSEGYNTKNAALNGIDSVRKNAQTKKVIEV